MSPINKNNFLNYFDCFLVDSEFRECDPNKYCFWGQNTENVEQEILNARSIFIRPGVYHVWSELLIFLSELYSLPVKLICICHSDDSIQNETIHALKRALPNTTFWIQNWCGDLSGCELLPIGVNNHGIQKIQQPIKKVPFLITFVTPNSKDREEFYDFLHTNKAIQAYCLPFLQKEEYCSAISEALFLACPCGNGYDTYRFWECLQYSTIPIVKNNIFFQNLKKQYPYLPFLVIQEWEDLLDLLPKLTIDYYKSILSTSDLSVATNEYWMNKFFSLLNT